MGYDIHRFDGKGPLRLGGVTIPFSRGLSGHSDADVLLHAIADALFGAIGAPDLGEQFPPGDPRYRKVDSRLFVRQAIAQVRRQGFCVGNVDATVIAEKPTLIGYKQKMAQGIGQLLDVDATQVSVKAKSTEGFSPGRRGIAAHVVVLLKRSPAAAAFSRQQKQRKAHRFVAITKLRPRRFFASSAGK